MPAIELEKSRKLAHLSTTQTRQQLAMISAKQEMMQTNRAAKIEFASIFCSVYKMKKCLGFVSVKKGNEGENEFVSPSTTEMKETCTHCIAINDAN